MNVLKQKENTVKIVCAINTVFISECCHSYCSKYILAHSGENATEIVKKLTSFCCEKQYKKYFGGAII